MAAAAAAITNATQEMVNFFPTFGIHTGFIRDVWMVDRPIAILYR